MTTINDIQDLVQIIEDRPEWRRELQRVLLTPDLQDTPSLIAENAKLIGKNAEAIDRLETVTAETAQLVAKNAESIDRLETLVEENTKSIKELTETTRISAGHIGDMRGLFASQKVMREAALITNGMGLRNVGTLESQDIIDMWEMGEAKGLTNNISKDDEKSFKLADLVIVARTDDGAWCYVAVEISYTVDERDTTRAIRNAEYIANFTETPCYAAVAGVSKDNRIDKYLTDVPQPYSSDQETRIFWSEHEDIVKPN